MDFLALLFVVGIAVAFMLCCARGFAWYACGVRACRFTMFWCNFVAGFWLWFVLICAVSILVGCLRPGRGFGLVVLICCFDCRLLELVVCGCVCVFCGLIAGCGLSWRGFGCGLRCLVWRF